MRITDTDSDTDSESPLPPDGGEAAAAAVEEARSRHGDRVAAFVAKHAAAIAKQLDGRFDLFLEALDAASLQDPPVRQVLSWCIARAKSRGRNPPAGVNGHAVPSKAAERSRRQREAFERVLADMTEDE